MLNYRVNLIGLFAMISVEKNKHYSLVISQILGSVGKSQRGAGGGGYCRQKSRGVNLARAHETIDNLKGSSVTLKSIKFISIPIFWKGLRQRENEI